MRITARLHELIAALDRRTPRSNAADELRIAQEAKVLRAAAVEQLGRIERRANNLDLNGESSG
jgi:hypothetical protein